MHAFFHIYNDCKTPLLLLVILSYSNNVAQTQIKAFIVIHDCPTSNTASTPDKILELIIIITDAVYTGSGAARRYATNPRQNTAAAFYL